MKDKRKKRWNREHSKRTAPQQPPPPPTRLVYRPKTTEEALRRVDRSNTLVGTPFVELPGIEDHQATAFVSKAGHKIRYEDVEMVFNDCLLMDAISNWGEDGPLYKDTLDTEIMKEVYEFAVAAYKGVEIPPQLRQPIQ